MTKAEKIISSDPEHLLKLLNSLHESNQSLCKKIRSARDVTDGLPEPEKWSEDYHKRVKAYLSAVQMTKTEMMIAAHYEREEYFNGLVTIDTYYSGKADLLDRILEDLTRKLKQYEGEE